MIVLAVCICFRLTENWIMRKIGFSLLSHLLKMCLINKTWGGQGEENMLCLKGKRNLLGTTEKKFIILFHVEIIQLAASSSDHHHMLCMNYWCNIGDGAANSANSSASMQAQIYLAYAWKRWHWSFWRVWGFF